MKFVYVFDLRDKKKMTEAGYLLIKEDEANKIWVFENLYENELACELDGPHVMSDVLSL